jgi:hypothetical protein
VLKLDKYHYQILDLLAENEQGIHRNGLLEKTKFPVKTLTKKLRDLKAEKSVEAPDVGKGVKKPYRITANGMMEITKNKAFNYVRDEIEAVLKSPPRKESQVSLIMVPPSRTKRNLFFLFYPSEEIQEIAQELFRTDNLVEGVPAKPQITKRLVTLKDLVGDTIRLFILSNRHPLKTLVVEKIVEKKHFAIQIQPSKKG